MEGTEKKREKVFNRCVSFTNCEADIKYVLTMASYASTGSCKNKCCSGDSKLCCTVSSTEMYSHILCIVRGPVLYILIVILVQAGTCAICHTAVVMVWSR